MIGWIKSIFGGLDRTTAASERTAKAMEDIADTLESVRDQLQARLGLETPPVTKVLVNAEEDEKKPRGRSKS